METESKPSSTQGDAQHDFNINKATEKSPEGNGIGGTDISGEDSAPEEILGQIKKELTDPEKDEDRRNNELI